MLTKRPSSPFNRPRWTEADAREALTALERSGRPVSVFAAEHGLDPQRLYVWRRRQYEALIGRLERELAKLRNLPFTEPAPLEDLPEVPSSTAARVMNALDDDAGY